MEKAARRIVEKLRRSGHVALFAGGWVRDRLLRRQPKDIDIVTSATPEQVLRLFRSGRAVGAAFGVVLVRLYGRDFEVATFRREGPYLDGRHPSHVEFASAREDAARRDFTANGLFYDPVEARILDYVDGEADIARRVLRAIGNASERFEEDRLRILRAVRFACALGFEIEPNTWKALCASAPAIRMVSAERVREELTVIFSGPAPARGLDLLSDSGLLRLLLPEVEAMKGVQQPPEFHPEGDVWTHTRLAMGLLRKPSARLAFATLLHDVGKPPTASVRGRIRFDGHVEVGARITKEICRRLRMSAELTDDIVDLVRQHLRFMHVREMRESTLKRFLRSENFAEHLELHRVDCLSSHRDLGYYEFCRRRWEQLMKESPPPKPILRGDDLIREGYAPGPIFRTILNEVENLQLEGVLTDRDAALEYVRRNYPLKADSKGTAHGPV